MNIFFNDNIKIFKLVSYKSKKIEITENDLKIYDNYDDVKSWFNVKGLDNKYLFIAVHHTKIVGYYFKCFEKGNRVEIIPEYRKNGIFSNYKVYEQLLEKILIKFPFGLYSTVSILNIPSLTTHFKHKFQIDDIVHLELCRGLEFYYEYNNTSYRFNNFKNFETIKNIFIYDNRNIKCYYLKDNEKIYLEKKDNCFFTEDLIYENLNKIKYKFLLQKNENYIERLKRFIKFFNKNNEKQIEEIGKSYNFELLGWLLENGYLSVEKVSNEFKYTNNDKLKSVEMLWDRYVNKKFYHEFDYEYILDKKYKKDNITNTNETLYGFINTIKNNFDKNKNINKNTKDNSDVNIDVNIEKKIVMDGECENNIEIKTSENCNETNNKQEIVKNECLELDGNIEKIETEIIIDEQSSNLEIKDEIYNNFELIKDEQIIQNNNIEKSCGCDVQNCCEN